MKILPLLLVSLAIMSCVHRENISLSAGESEGIDSLSVISQMITAIPLETNSQCKLTEFQQVKSAQSNFFVRSGNEIYRFYRTGLFLNKISVDDHVRIYQYAIDPDNQQVIVLDSISMIHFYAYDGTPLFTKDAEAALPGETMLDLTYHDHFLWVVTQKIADNNAIEK